MSIADAFRTTAAAIGARPEDLATVASYESGGRFDPAIRGGAGNRYVGMFQFGPWEQQHYGVSQQTPAEQQIAAAGRFLVDRGFRPGMSLLDMYSAINAGRVGRYDASDASNGGAPGTVRDKVEQQMEGHKAKAVALLGALGGNSGASPSQPPRAGTDLAAALGPGVALPTLAPVLPVPVPTEPDPAVQAQQIQQLQEQRAQQEQQRKQALLSVSAFYR
ncbi:hypothetical protein [Methylobacterium brachiatum]|uniref:hypothetical protein n=1 Tax=Methylobacterium brachiatum TaxID=269660 RepID=UPI0008F1E56C|nr:hypothetical protein [Methylobacterium brachiatum]SFI05887.1 hypothetical protein SAMN02799642_00582 [Methylobacterium brachiatum]